MTDEQEDTERQATYRPSGSGGCWQMRDPGSGLPHPTENLPQEQTDQHRPDQGAGRRDDGAMAIRRHIASTVGAFSLLEGETVQLQSRRRFSALGMGG
jgi:hypothetical protein